MFWPAGSTISSLVNSAFLVPSQCASELNACSVFKARPFFMLISVQRFSLDGGFDHPSTVGPLYELVGVEDLNNHGKSSSDGVGLGCLQQVIVWWSHW